MLPVFLDDPINLGATLFKNRQPLTGQTVSVRVIDQNGGAELLPTTNVPVTTEPNVHNFVWNRLNPNPPPIKTSDLVAFFTVKNEIFPELIQLRPKTKDAVDLVATVEDNTELVAVLSEAEDLSAEISDGSITATVEDATELIAVIADDNQLEGEI